MTVMVYESTDAGAPVLTGQAGSLLALLDAVLVNGYGSKAGAGWEIAFTGVDRRAYRMPAGSSRRYLRLDDAVGGGAYAAVACYDQMTDVDTGTGPFPAIGTVAYWHKSANASTTARPWTVLVDGAWVWFLPQSHSSALTALLGFGDLTEPAARVHSAVLFSNATGSARPGHQTFIDGNSAGYHNTPLTTYGRTYPRTDGTPLEGAISLWSHGMFSRSYFGISWVSSPAANGDALLLDRHQCFASNSNNSWTGGARVGVLPGLLANLTSPGTNLAGQTLTDVIDLAPRQVMVRGVYNSFSGGQLDAFFDLGPWR